MLQATRLCAAMPRYITNKIASEKMNNAKWETLFNEQNLTLKASCSYLIGLFSDISGRGLHE